MGRKIYTDHNGKTRIGEIELFLEIAIEQASSAIRFSDEQSELLTYEHEVYDPFSNKMITLKGWGHLDRLFFIDSERTKNEIQGITALSTFYEALINEIAITELGSTYFKKHLDKLTHLSKWEIVLQLVYGRSLDNSKEYFEHLKKLVEARNQLVHYRTKTPEGENQINQLKILVNGLKSFLILLEDLRQLDTEKGIIKFTIPTKYLERIGEL
ncbi:hypothetical protein [Marinoscillum sp.]|uniref:hypothetical protein n=1 Tax=Marinoscillum sp. TaxID=2024838 RepID=UPI003BAB32F8